MSIRRALLFSFIERYLLLMVSLGSSMLLARLLTPKEIGVYSVSMAAVGIAQVLRDFGVANFLVQEPKLSEAHIRTAFGAMLILGLFMFFALVGLAPWITLVYDEPQLLLLLRISALNFLVLPFCTVSLALLRRDMAFKKLAALGIVSACASAAVSLFLAYFGYGVVSLAWGGVTLNVVTGLLAWWLRPGRRILLPSFSEWRRVMGFGVQSSLISVVTSIAMDINDLGVGKFVGFEGVALLSRAQGLMNIFHRDVMSAIRNVAFPAYARAARNGTPLEPLHIISVTHVTVTAWPFYGFASLFALEIMRLMFGQQWDNSATLVPIFCLAGAIAAPMNLIGNLIVAQGRMDILARVELTFQPARAALIIFAAFFFRSTEACAIALVIAYACQLPLLYWAKAKFAPNDWASLIDNLARSVKVAAISLLGPLTIAALHNFWRVEPMPVGWFVLAGASCVISWFFALSVCRHPMAADPAFRRVTRGWFDPRDDSAKR